MCLGARSVYIDDVPGIKLTLDSKLPPWSLYNEPDLYDRVFGEREFDEEVSDPCSNSICLQCLKTQLSSASIRSTALVISRVSAYNPFVGYR